MSSIKKISMDKLFTMPNEKNVDLVSNHCNPLQSEPTKLNIQKSSSLQNMHTQEYQSDNLVTLISHDETPLSSRKETTSDLRKYIKMVYNLFVYTLMNVINQT
jgi:hypothetical protein